MPFKFRLGEWVVPSEEARSKLGMPTGPSEVIGIQLNDYIRIQVVGTPTELLVRAQDYEIFEDKTRGTLG